MSRSRLMLLCARWMRWLGELNVTLTGASSLHAIHSCVGLTYPPLIHQTLMFCVRHVYCDCPSSLTSVTALESCLFYFHSLCLPFGFTVPWLTSPYDLELLYHLRHTCGHLKRFPCCFASSGFLDLYVQSHNCGEDSMLYWKAVRQKLKQNWTRHGNSRFTV